MTKKHDAKGMVSLKGLQETCVANNTELEIVIEVGDDSGVGVRVHGTRGAGDGLCEFRLEFSDATLDEVVSTTTRLMGAHR